MLQLFKKNPPALSSAPLSPLDRLLSVWFALAYEEQATAIVIGLPRSLPPEVAVDAGTAPQREPRAGGDPQHLSDADRALAASSRLRSATGWQTVPVWMRIDGSLYPHYGVPVECHFAFLSLVQERLVSLGASETNPKPMRYIEYHPAGGVAERCFAEVELWLDGDNTVRIEILGHRREPLTVRAVPSVY